MIEYSLHDDILVSERNAKHFENKVSQFIREGSFRRICPSYSARLSIALKSLKPFEYEGHRRAQHFAKVREERIDPHEKVYRYVNLHIVPSLQELDLAEIMTRCADDQLYTEINGLVVREIQNFVTRAKMHQAHQTPSHGRRYCRAIRQYTPKNLGAYLFGLGAYLPTLAEEGWRSLGVFQNITGPLNTITEFWELDPWVSLDDLEEAPHNLWQPKTEGARRLYERVLEPYLELALLCEYFCDAPYLIGQTAHHPTSCQ